MSLTKFEKHGGYDKIELSGFQKSLIWLFIGWVFSFWFYLPLMIISPFAMEETIQNVFYLKGISSGMLPLYLLWIVTLYTLLFPIIYMRLIKFKRLKTLKLFVFINGVLLLGLVSILVKNWREFNLVIFYSSLTYLFFQIAFFSYRKSEKSRYGNIKIAG